MYWIVVVAIILAIIVGWWIYLERLRSEGAWVSGGHGWDLPMVAIIIVILIAVAAPKFLALRAEMAAECPPATAAAGAVTTAAGAGDCP